MRKRPCVAVHFACPRMKCRYITNSHSLLPTLVFLALFLDAAGGEMRSQTGRLTQDGAVWSVDAETGGRLYICGTIHALREADYPLAPAYEAAYIDSARLVFELPPGSNSAGIPRLRIQDVGVLPGDQSLQRIVGQTSWEEVVKWAGSRKTSLATLNRYRPWFAAVTIAAIEYGALGARPDKGVDSYFEARMARDRKPGEGLETVDYQVGLFSSLTAAQQEDMLRQTLAEAKNLPEEFAKTIKAWREGDLESLRKILYREAERYPDLMDLFLYQRNKAWLATLEEFLKKGDRVMVLVGAGHLAGEKGLIELLKTRGYKMNRFIGGNPQPGR